MNKKNTSFPIVLIIMAFCLCGLTGYSQKTTVPVSAKQPATTPNSGKTKTATRVNLQTISKYETMAANPKFKDQKILLELADFKFSLSDFKEAEKYYTRLFNVSDKQTEKVYLKYAQCLKKTNKQNEYKVLMAKYSVLKKSGWKVAPGSKTGASSEPVVAEKRNYSKEIKANSGRYTVTNFDAINTEYSDFGGTVKSGTSFVFTSTYSRKKNLVGTPASNLSVEEKNTYLDLFASNLEGSTKVKEFKIQGLKFPYSVSSPTFSSDGSTMYYTRNVISKELGKDVLMIFRATLSGNKWQDIIEMPFNSKDFSYNTAHPFLTNDGRRLYFTSDKPKGYGKTDIYYVNVKGGKDYTFPINLGKKINTKGKETFPFESKKGDFYFSSDGRPGLGKLDIFVSRRTKNTFGEVYNVGAPVNSSSDDICFYIDDYSRKGYITSDRSGGKGSDDIYNITETKKLKTVFK